MRKTKIVATVGPATHDEKRLELLIREGADVLRINASHTTPASLRKWILHIRKAALRAQKHAGILVDLQGPRVRTGKLKGRGPLGLKAGEEVVMEVGNHLGGGHTLTTACREFPQMVKEGDRVLLDNGAMELRVTEVRGKAVRCFVVSGGLLGENKGINLPFAPVTLPALTEKDLYDLAIAARLNVDYLALSFVRSEADVLTLRQWLEQRKKQIPVIAKIEKPRAVNCLEAILKVSGGVMVARGDLGIEMGVEKVPAVQKMLIERANQKNVPVITATQMLETMIEKPYPTRAEVSDIANAVFDGTDAVMLSGETAIGKYAVQAVRLMSEIILEAEKHIKTPSPYLIETEFKHGATPVHAVTHAARNAAYHLSAKAIVVFTLSGLTAQLISKLRPACPIVVLTPSEKICARLSLLRGVTAIKTAYSPSTDQMIRTANQTILKSGLLKRNDPVVLVSGKQALPGLRFMTKIHTLGER